MTLLNLSQDKFEVILQEHVRPSRAIDSIEHLFDRERQLNRIEEALSSPGRHVFIYGDRGAGKTSRARTAAFKHHPSDGEPVYSACGQQTTFSAIVRDIASQLDERSHLSNTDKTVSAGAKAAVRGIGVESSYSEKETQRELTGLDLNAATAAIREAAQKRPGRSVIVVDDERRRPPPLRRAH